MIEGYPSRPRHGTPEPRRGTNTAAGDGVAGRTGRPATDHQLELIAFVLAAVMFTASRRWVAEQGATPLATLVD